MGRKIEVGGAPSTSVAVPTYVPDVVRMAGTFEANIFWEKVPKGFA
jgi:hypothetical protein